MSKRSRRCWQCGTNLIHKHTIPAFVNSETNSELWTCFTCIQWILEQFYKDSELKSDNWTKYTYKKAEDLFYYVCKNLEEIKVWQREFKPFDKEYQYQYEHLERDLLAFLDEVDSVNERDDLKKAMEEKYDNKTKKNKVSKTKRNK